MADILAIGLAASIDWTFSDALDLSTISDNAKLAFSLDLADGTGDNQVDKIWHDKRTIAIAADDDIDLRGTGANMTHSIFGGTVTIELAKVKAILIKNLSTVSGEDLTIGGHPTQDFSAPFGASGDKIKLGAGGALLLTQPVDGWTVTDGTSDTLRIHNDGAASVNYDIVIAGVGV